MELGRPGGLRATSVLVRRTRAARPPAWRRSAARARTTAGAANCGRSDLRTAHHELLRGLPREPDAASARRPRLHTPPRRCDLRDLRQRFCHRESHVDPCRRHRTGSLTDARANFMAAALLGIGLSADDHSWSTATATPLLFAAGVGHACGFSPVAERLTDAVQEAQAAQLSGLILTASLVGQVVGVAAFVGVYLSAAARGSAQGLAVTTLALCGTLALTAAVGSRASVDNSLAS